MAIDLKVFDDAIVAKGIEIQSAQDAVDNDVLAQQLKVSQALGTKLADEQNAKASIENKKSQFISIQASIDTKSQEIIDLKKVQEDLKASL